MTAYPIDNRMVIFYLDEHFVWFVPLPGFEAIAVDPARPPVRKDWETGRRTWCARLVLRLEALDGATWSRDEVVATVRRLLAVPNSSIQTGGAFLVQGGIYVSENSGTRRQFDGLQIFLINTEQIPIASFRVGVLALGLVLALHLRIPDLYVELQLSGVPRGQVRVAT